MKCIGCDFAKRCGENKYICTYGEGCYKENGPLERTSQFKFICEKCGSIYIGSLPLHCECGGLYRVVMNTNIKKDMAN